MQIGENIDRKRDFGRNCQYIVASEWGEIYFFSWGGGASCKRMSRVFFKEKQTVIIMKCYHYQKNRSGQSLTRRWPLPSSLLHAFGVTFYEDDMLAAIVEGCMPPQAYLHGSQLHPTQSRTDLLVLNIWELFISSVMRVFKFPSAFQHCETVLFKLRYLSTNKQNKFCLQL